MPPVIFKNGRKITLLNYFIKEIALIRWMALVVAAKQDSVVHGASITLMIVSRYLVEMVTHKSLLFFFFNLLHSKLCFSIVAYAYFYMISWILKEFWFLHNLWYIGVQTHWWRHHYNRQRLAFSSFSSFSSFFII